MSGSAFAVDNLWNGSVSDDWNTAGNWSLGLPTAPDDAIINNAGAFPVPVISADLTVNPRDVVVGNGGGTGQLDMTAGTIAPAGWTFIGRGLGSNGTFNVNAPGGSYSTGRLAVGDGGTGFFNMTAGTVNSGGAEMWIGNGATGVGKMVMTGGIVNSDNWTVVGRNGANGTLNMSGGTINKTGGGNFINGDNGLFTVDQSNGAVINSNNEFWVGQGGGSTGGRYSLSGPSVGAGATRINSTGTMIVGRGGAGDIVMDQSGGTVTISAGELQIGQDGGSNGTYNLSGGTITGNNWVAVGRNSATGRLNISGGELIKNGGGHLTIGTLGTNSNGRVDVTGNGIITMNAGAGNVLVGEGGTTSTGQLNIDGNGLVDLSSGALVVAVGTSTTGTANLIAGTLRTQLIGSGSNTGVGVGDSAAVGNVSTINFTGTQVIATAATADFISQIDTANLVTGGGLKINSNGNNIGSSQVFSGGGGIVKSGVGIFTLSASSSYTGKTTVQVGTIALAATGSIGASTTIEVQAGAFLDVSAVSGWTLATGQTLQGNGTVMATAGANLNGTVAPGASPGTLTVVGPVSMGGVYNYDYNSGSSSADLLDVNGTLLLSGILLPSELGIYNVGDKFTIAAYEGLLSGTFANYATDDTTYSINGNQWMVNYNDTTAGLNGPGDTPTGSTSFITMTAVPEPSALLLGSLGVMTLLRRRRVS